MEFFNLNFAYLFYLILQIFNQKHLDDYTEVDRIEVQDDNLESELFISPVVKERFGLVVVGILLFYLTFHLYLFASVVIKDCKNTCKARCGKNVGSN
jgi:hypothetical protein